MKNFKSFLENYSLYIYITEEVHEEIKNILNSPTIPLHSKLN